MPCVQEGGGDGVPFCVQVLYVQRGQGGAGRECCGDFAAGAAACLQGGARGGGHDGGSAGWGATGVAPQVREAGLGDAGEPPPVGQSAGEDEIGAAQGVDGEGSLFYGEGVAYEVQGVKAGGPVDPGIGCPLL